MNKKDLRLPDYRFGRVIEVDGNTITLRAENLFTQTSPIYYCEVGAYVNCGGEHGNTLCIVNKIRIEEVQRYKSGTNELSYYTEEIKKVTLSIIGSIIDGAFDRGTSRLPTIGCHAYFLNDEQINSIIGNNNKFSDEYFLVTDDEKEKVYLNLDKIVGRHTAILGTTGSGKSSTVASLIQSILECYKHPRFVFFDLHNEYPAAFGHGGKEVTKLKEKTNCISWGEFNLPYWFLNLEEFLEVFYPSAGASQEVALKEIIQELKIENSNLSADYKKRISADTPCFFKLEDLIDKLKEKDEKNSPSKKEYTKIISRLESIYNDSRYIFLRRTESSKTTLSDYLKLMLGLHENQKYLNIYDLSGLPSEVRNVCIGVLSRLFFDFKFWDSDPESLPLAMVLEEAHSYIPENSDKKFSLCRERIERIAKEGRKYGIGLFVVTQRPSNISTTVLSQCGTYITLRLTNDVDQNKVQRLLPDTLAGQTDILPSLRDGEALISGDGIKIPRRVKFKKPDPSPKSNDVRYHISWKQGLPENHDINEVTTRWQKMEK